MGGLEVTLIVIGLLIIAASYVISEKMTTKETEKEKEFLTVEDYEKRKELEESFTNQLDRIAEESIEKAEAAVCRLSNEKIMAVNEYGDMVLERIDKNHSEVVFLYSMLTDKEKELKQLLWQPSEETLKESEAHLEEESTEEPPVEPVVMQENELQQEQPVEEKPHQMPELHERILSYLKEGRTVREISMELELGQGEVQLIANLYAGGAKE